MTTFNDFMEGADESRKRRRYGDIMREAREHRSPAAKALVDLCTYRHGVAAAWVAKALWQNHDPLDVEDPHQPPRDIKIHPGWGDHTTSRHQAELILPGNVSLIFEVREQTRRGRRNHRLYAVCPDCERWIPASRTHQHCGTRRCRGDR